MTEANLCALLIDRQIHGDGNDITDCKAGNNAQKEGFYELFQKIVAQFDKRQKANEFKTLGNLLKYCINAANFGYYLSLNI